ncbi:MAG: O-antigen ligase family protein [Oscillatoria sp. SIO1A7]|nr:O-antigen ligase family protein [Oscillatoria sp. SIO1A7]
MAKASSLNSLLVSIVRLVLAIEPWFAFFIMLMCTGAFFDIYEEAGYGVARIKFYLWKLLEIGAVGFMLLRWQRVLRQLATNGKFLLAFLALLWISRYWSIDPGKTITQTLYVVESSILGIYIATRYNFEEQTRLLTIMFSIASVLSIFYVFAMPTMGTHTGQEAIWAGINGYWRGIYTNKNALGRVITIAGIFLLLEALTSKNRWLAWGIFLISFQLIVGTNSKTALVGFLFIVAISPVARVFRWNMAVGIPLYLSVLLLGGVGAIFLGDNWNTALDTIDKDPTLNGRLPIWEIMIQRIGERPWLGYGYHGFWQGWDGKQSAEIWRTIHWLPGHAHHGFLEVMLDLGILGGFVFGLAFFDAILKSINRSRYTPSLKGLWPLGFMTFYVIMNQTQSELVVAYGIGWLLFMLICLTPVEPPAEDSKLKSSSDRLGSAPKLTGSSKLKSRG